MSDEKDKDWEMPKPVFRSTDGSVPRNLEDTISLSFAPNKEPVEIDASDDILGIMEANYNSDAAQRPGASEHDSMLEKEATADAVESKNVGSVDPVVAAPPASPMNVTKKDDIPETKQINPRRADLLTYVAMVIIGVGLFIAAVYYYFLPPPPVR